MTGNIFINEDLGLLLSQLKNEIDDLDVTFSEASSALNELNSICNNKIFKNNLTELSTKTRQASNLSIAKLEELRTFAKTQLARYGGEINNISELLKQSIKDIEGIKKELENARANENLPTSGFDKWKY